MNQASMNTIETKSLDHLFSPCCIVNDKLEVQYFNPSMATFLQLPPRKINQQSVESLLTLGASFWADLFETCKSNQTAISEEVDFTQGSQTYSFVFRMIKLEEARFLIFSNDLSVEKTLHSKYREQLRLLKESHQQVVQADKVRAIGELTAGISHEINNPLTVASGNTELLGFALEGENLEDQREVITQSFQNIDEALNRIETIISGMKGFLHQGIEDRKEYINLKDVIANSVNLTQGTIEAAGITLETTIAVDSPVVLGNKTRLEQVLINLIQNACDSLKDSGKEDRQLKIILERNSQNHLFSLSVVDNGTGIKEEIKEKIFENFYTTKEMGEGTGLGLSLCQKIVEDHQGSLDLMESQEGAHFLITLPVIEVSSFASNEEIFSKLNDINGRKILVVDNDVAILNLCQRFMEETSYIFIGSTGGEEAIAVFDKYDVDAVITDLNMPGLSGTEFVKKLREISNVVPIFYLSDESGKKQYEADKKTFHLSGFLAKPFKSDELLSMLGSLFHKKEEG